MKGIYRYWRDGARQDISEPWSTTPTASGHVLRGQRVVGGIPLLDIEAVYEGTHCTRLQLHWQPAQGHGRVFVYQLNGKGLEWGADDEAGRTLAVPPGSMLFPLLRAASGRLISQLRGPNWVVLPNLQDPNGPEFLQPLLSKRWTELIGDEPEGRHYRYFGGEYGDAGADYWLNRDGLVAHYRWNSPQGDWDVRLD